MNQFAVASLPPPTACPEVVYEEYIDTQSQCIPVRRPSPFFGLGQTLGYYLGTCDIDGNATPRSAPFRKYTQYIIDFLSRKPNDLHEDSVYDHQEITNDWQSVSYSYSDSFEVIEHQMLPVAQQLRKMIEQERDKSTQTGKPLLFLLGEAHDTIQSMMVETMLIHQVKSEIPIQLVFTESFHRAHRYNNNILELQLSQAQLHRVLIDIALCPTFHLPKDSRNDQICEMVQSDLTTKATDYSLENWGTRKKPMQLRNRVMAQVMNALSRQGPSIAIVGSAHLYGLLRETDLRSHFHVVPIMIQSPAHHDLLAYYQASPLPQDAYMKQVTQFSLSHEVTQIEPAAMPDLREILDVKPMLMFAETLAAPPITNNPTAAERTRTARPQVKI